MCGVTYRRSLFYQSSLLVGIRVRYRWIPRPYTVRNQARYSWHGTIGLCWNTNTVGRRDWKIGSIPLSFNSFLSHSSLYPVVLSIISYTRLPPIRHGSCHSARRCSGINTFLSYHISTHRSISHVSPMWSHHRGDSSTSIRSRAKRIARRFSHQSGTVLLREKNSNYIR